MVDLTPEAEPQPITDFVEVGEAAAKQAEIDERVQTFVAELGVDAIETLEDGTVLVIVGDEKVAQPFHDQIKIIDGTAYDMRFTPDPVMKAAQDAADTKGQ